MPAQKPQRGDGKQWPQPLDCNAWGVQGSGYSCSKPTQTACSTWVKFPCFHLGLKGFVRLQAELWLCLTHSLSPIKIQQPVQSPVAAGDKGERFGRNEPSTSPCLPPAEPFCRQVCAWAELQPLLTAALHFRASLLHVFV